MAKFIDIVTWIFFIAGVLSCAWWFIVSPIIGYIGSGYALESEVRLYLRVFMLLLGVIAFGILRLFNGVVNNTRFSIKLREALIKFTNAIPGLERSMKNLNSSLGNVKASVDLLKRSIDSIPEKRDK